MNKVNLKDKAAVIKAAEVIKGGGMVLYPTDTVYILAVDARQQGAVDKLLGFKDRWAGKAISVAVTDIEMAENYVVLNDKSRGLYRSLLPGPFTIVSPGRHKTARGIEAENGTLGIRIPDNKYVHELVKAVGSAVTATSANLSGRSPHYTVESFWRTLSKKKKEMVDLVADAGRLPKNKPSTVIDASEGEIKILRRGDLIAGGVKEMLSKSERETGKIAEFIMKKVIRKAAKRRAVILGLSGDLGTGKTVFSRAVGNFLGVRGRVTSPTYVIYNEFEIEPKTREERKRYDKFLHFDLYRIKDNFEFDELGFFELFSPGTVAAVEWPENMGRENFDRLKQLALYVPVHFEYVDDRTRRVGFGI